MFTNIQIIAVGYYWYCVLGINDFEKCARRIGVTRDRFENIRTRGVVGTKTQQWSHTECTPYTPYRFKVFFERPFVYIFANNFQGEK